MVELPKSIRDFLDTLTPAEVASVLGARLTVGSHRRSPHGDGCLIGVVGRGDTFVGAAFDRLHYDLQDRGLHTHVHEGPASALVVDAIRDYVMGRLVPENRPAQQSENAVVVG